jgi:hypothetical protein
MHFHVGYSNGSTDLRVTNADLMAPLVHDPVQQCKESGLGAANHLTSSGALEVMRITKAVPTGNGDLQFLGVPARHGSTVRSLLVSFIAEDTMPAPEMDPINGRVHLYYPHRDHPEVQLLLNRKRKRFCYFWRSAEGDHTHAWVISSR